MDVGEIIRTITRANASFETAARSECVRELITTPPGGIARTFLSKREIDSVDVEHLNDQAEDDRAVRLVIIITAKRLPQGEDMEALRLCGVRGCGVPRRPKAKDRYALVGSDRQRAVTKPEAFVKGGHRKRLEDALEGNLYEILRQRPPRRFEKAIEEYGGLAVDKHL
jgi:hypothetical protein